MNSAPSSPPASPHAHTPVRSPASLAAWTPWFLVMTLTVLCLWLVQLYFTTQAQNSLLRDQQRLTELELRNARQHAEAERILAGRELADLRKQLAEK